MQRRTLQYASWGDFRTDLQHLRDRPYQRAGQWSLAQNCDHMNRVIVMSLDGFPMKVPLPLRVLGPVMKWFVLRRGSIPAGVAAPKEMQPVSSPDENDQAKVDELLATISRYESNTAPLHPSPLFGKLSREEWNRIHLIHAAHHMSFMIPQ